MSLDILSPLKWEHINLTGDYHWRRDGGLRKSEVATTPDRLCTTRDPSLACKFLRTASDPHFMEFGENLLAVEPRRFRAACSARLKRESRAEIDLQEVVLGSVNDIPGGFGEHPNMGSKAILEPSAKVAQHPVAKAQATIRAYPIVPRE